jgi:hypothetical protein
MPGLLELLGVAYLVVGAGVATRLHRSGRVGLGGAVGAFAAWPVFLPVLAGPSSGAGPFANRIVEVFAALERTLHDPAADDVAWSSDVAVDLSGLQTALFRADDRIALVDRLLSEARASGPRDPARLAALTAPLDEARALAADELSAVLDEVVQLRLQIGLAALHGNAASVRQRLAELQARAEAIDEVSEVSSHVARAG